MERTWAGRQPKGPKRAEDPNRTKAPKRTEDPDRTKDPSHAERRKPVEDHDNDTDNEARWNPHTHHRDLLPRPVYRRTPNKDIRIQLRLAHFSHLFYEAIFINMEFHDLCKPFDAVVHEFSTRGGDSGVGISGGKLDHGSHGVGDQ